MPSMSSSRQQNRRRFARSSVGYLVQLQPINPPLDDGAGCVNSCLSRDISRGGMGVWVEHVYPLRSRLVVTFEREDNGIDRITSRIGSVVWINPIPTEQKTLIGIEFTEDGG
jgi:hypothetical protein